MSHQLGRYCHALAVVRFVPRANKAPKLFALAPMLGSTGSHPDCWVASQLPFQQDMRLYTFPPLVPEKRPDLLPT
jgi:hypothetical protein